MFTVELNKHFDQVFLRNSNLPETTQVWWFSREEAKSLIEGLQAAVKFMEQGPCFHPWEVVGKK